MKRTPLTRKTPLETTTPLARGDTPLARGSGLRRDRKRPFESPESAAARSAWNVATKANPTCARCGKRGYVSGHHVVEKRHVKARGGDIWDLRNQLSVCPDCHLNHHQGGEDRRIPLSALRPENVAFATELLGDAAGDYLARYYAGR